MPKGIYKRKMTPAVIKAMKKNLAKGHSKASRKKQQAAMKRKAADPLWRMKVSEATKIAMHRPNVRRRHLAGLVNSFKNYSAERRAKNFLGGRGRPPLPIMIELAKIFEPMGFIPEYEIKTKGHGTKWTNVRHSYAVDFGHPQTKVAIEIDGPCHRSSEYKLRDEKKQAVLENLGWQILRLKHR